MASLDTFLPVTLGDPCRKLNLADATTGFANPTSELLREAQRVFKDNVELAPIVSLGAGKVGITRIIQNAGAIGQGETLRRIAKSCKEVHKNVYRSLHATGIYFRFDPEACSQQSPSSWASQASAYIQEGSINIQTDSVVKKVHGRQGGVSIKEISVLYIFP